jgi:hypothetical protein
MWIIETVLDNEIRHNSRLKNFLRAAALTTGLTLGAIFPSYGQHNVHIKTNTLDQSAQGTPIAGAVISKDQGDVVKVTDANGDAMLTNVNGTMSIKAIHPDYKQFEQTFTINSDTTLYFAMPKNIRIGNWGIDTLRVDWYKNTFQAATNDDTDPSHWKQIAPINNRLKPGQYSYADSLLVVDAINNLESGTGYDLIKLIPNTASKDTTYTIELNSFTNFSSISTNINMQICKGYSQITTTNEMKRIIHEITQQFDMWPYPGNNVPAPGSVMDPAVQTMTDPKKWDFDYIALTFDQSYRKKNGKQNLFLSQMSEYVALGNVGLVSITSPVNGATDLDTLLNILGSKDANAMWYDFKIATDAAGNNVFIAQNDVDRPRINVDLEPGKTYFLFERARNGTSTGLWSGGNKITTKALLTTGVENIILGHDLLIYPNPTTHDITVEYYLLRQSKINICLYNIGGKKMTCYSFKESSGLQSHTIDLTCIGNGIYILKLVTLDSGQERLIKALKFIKN